MRSIGVLVVKNGGQRPPMPPPFRSERSEPGGGPSFRESAGPPPDRFAHSRCEASASSSSRTAAKGRLCLPLSDRSGASQVGVPLFESQRAPHLIASRTADAKHRRPRRQERRPKAAYASPFQIGAERARWGSLFSRVSGPPT